MPTSDTRFRKKRRTGVGSFRADSGVTQIKYDGKRRIRLPVIGSVKLDHTLPKGIPYEAHISRRNGQCPACQTTPDRNLNAAVNLRNLLVLPAGSGVTLRDGEALAADSLCRETGPWQQPRTAQDDRRTAQSEPSAPATLTVCGHSDGKLILTVNTS